QTSRKKKQKFQLTLGFTVNVDGSKKFLLFFIGYAKKPNCFNSKPPQSSGYYLLLEQ
ncbi:hypothetical protein PAXRUDRAFT_137836, partial [Paxillus rubicundulus Ve08.2h10]